MQAVRYGVLLRGTGQLQLPLPLMLEKSALAPTRKFLALQKDWARVRTLGDGLLSNILGLTHQDLTFTALFKYEYLQE